MARTATQPAATRCENDRPWLRRGLAVVALSLCVVLGGCRSYPGRIDIVNETGRPLRVQILEGLIDTWYLPARSTRAWQLAFDGTTTWPTSRRRVPHPSRDGHGQNSSVVLVSDGRDDVPRAFRVQTREPVTLVVRDDPDGVIDLSIIEGSPVPPFQQYGTRRTVEPFDPTVLNLLPSER